MYGKVRTITASSRCDCITSEVLYQLSYVGAGWILACERTIVPIRPGLPGDVPMMCTSLASSSPSMSR